MGMILGLKTLGKENQDKVQQDPAFIWRVLAPDDPEAYQAATQSRRQGLFSRLFGRKSDADEDEVPEIAYAPHEGEETDLDKSWHGLHYLLTQTAWEGRWPHNFLLAGGRVAGEVDVGYGPARLMSVDETLQIHQMLQSIDEAWLRSRFNPQHMMQLEIYPEIWDRDPADDDTLGYCLEYFEILKDFVAAAAQHQLGMVVYLS